MDTITSASFTIHHEPSRSYLAGEGNRYVRTSSKHQRGVCVFTLIKCHDGSMHLVPHATVIAAHPIVDPTPVYGLSDGDVFTIDGRRYRLHDDKPLHNPQVSLVTEGDDIERHA